LNVMTDSIMEPRWVLKARLACRYIVTFDSLLLL
jgi:hypothetical protein